MKKGIKTPSKRAFKGYDVFQSHLSFLKNYITEKMLEECKPPRKIGLREYERIAERLIERSDESSVVENEIVDDTIDRLENTPNASTSQLPVIVAVHSYDLQKQSWEIFDDDDMETDDTPSNSTQEKPKINFEFNYDDQMKNDKYFLKSLIPCLKIMPFAQKLETKIEILNILRKSSTN